MQKLLSKLPITKYGHQEVGEWFIIILGIILFSLIAGFYSIIFLCLLGVCFILYFFRDPHRHVPEGENLIISPADGKVSSIEEMDEPSYVGERCVRISIFLNVFNVHVNRAPVKGKVEDIQYKVGDYHNAASLEKSESNESNYIGMKTPSGTKIGCKQIAGLIARKIVCKTRVGDELNGGEKFGMIKFGSRTDIFVPLSAKANIEVEVGQIVEGGSSILGRL